MAGLIYKRCNNELWVPVVCGNLVSHTFIRNMHHVRSLGLNAFVEYVKDKVAL